MKLYRHSCLDLCRFPRNRVLAYSMSPSRQGSLKRSGSCSWNSEGAPPRPLGRPFHEAGLAVGSQAPRRFADIEQRRWRNHATTLAWRTSGRSLRRWLATSLSLRRHHSPRWQVAIVRPRVAQRPQPGLAEPPAYLALRRQMREQEAWRTWVEMPVLVKHSPDRPPEAGKTRQEAPRTKLEEGLALASRRSSQLAYLLVRRRDP